MGAASVYTLLSVAGVSLISFVGAFALRANAPRVVLYFISFSAGALLGDVFLHLLPELFEANARTASFAVLSGILLFFVLERLILWHHPHRSHKEEVHVVAHLSIIGDALHNFLDGVAIATSFLVSIPVGVATTMAVIFHEIPQEIGQFAILIHGGWSRAKALLYNFLSALTAVLGAVLVLIFSDRFAGIVPALLGVSAASFLYVAMADVLPELREEQTMSGFFLQLLAMLVGVGVMLALLVFE